MSSISDVLGIIKFLLSPPKNDAECDS
uniref:Uncharacterized protein n=1 Tax=Anguilla anguilla TaxID=7936 RepID=A0A0E9VUL2_ANGAN